MAEAIRAIRTAQFDGRLINIFENKKRFNDDGLEISNTDRLLNYADTAGGTFRIFQIIERVIKAVVEVLVKVGSSMAGFFKGVGAKFALAWTMLTIPRLPGAIKSMVGSWKALGKDVDSKSISGAVTRRAFEAMDKTGDGVAAFLYATSLVTGSTACKVAGDVPDMIHNVADAGLRGQDLRLAVKTLQSAVAENVDPIVQKGLEDTKKLNFLRMMKAVCSAVTGIFSLTVLAFGGPLAPAIIMILIGIASTCFAISAALFESGMPYKEVKFFDTKHFQQIIPVAAV